MEISTLFRKVEDKNEAIAFSGQSLPTELYFLFCLFSSPLKSVFVEPYEIACQAFWFSDHGKPKVYTIKCQFNAETRLKSASDPALHWSLE